VWEGGGAGELVAVGGRDDVVEAGGRVRPQVLGAEAPLAAGVTLRDELGDDRAATHGWMLLVDLRLGLGDGSEAFAALLAACYGAAAGGARVWCPRMDGWQDVARPKAVGSGAVCRTVFL